VLNHFCLELVGHIYSTLECLYVGIEIKSPTTIPKDQWFYHLLQSIKLYNAIFNFDYTSKHLQKIDKITGR